LADGPQTAAAQAPETALAIEGTALSDDGMATVRLRNVGSKTITAYALADSTNPSYTLIMDFFEGLGLEDVRAVRLPGVEPATLGGIAAGQPTSAKIGRNGPDFPLIKVLAVVFADRTASGEEKQIQRIFGRRSEEAAELSRWCSLMTPERLAGMDNNAVASALSGIASEMRKAPPATGAAEATRRSLVDRLDGLDQRARGQDLTPVLTYLRARCAAAAVHSRREEVQ